MLKRTCRHIAVWLLVVISYAEVFTINSTFDERKAGQQHAIEANHTNGVVHGVNIKSSIAVNTSKSNSQRYTVHNGTSSPKLRSTVTSGRDEKHENKQPISPEAINNQGADSKPEPKPDGHVPMHPRLKFMRYKHYNGPVKCTLQRPPMPYNYQYHVRRRGHLYFFNQYVYELKTLRSSFYQFVKKGCTLTVYYQSLNTEPVTVYISDHYDTVLHDNNLKKSGNITLTSNENMVYEICLENFSWEAKKVFLSIRVESRRNSKIMMSPHHMTAHTIIGHLRNMEVTVRSMQSELWHRKAHLLSNFIEEKEKDDFAIWITWMVVLFTLVVYTLQVVEVHRVVKSAESKCRGGGAYIRLGLGMGDPISY